MHWNFIARSLNFRWLCENPPWYAASDEKKMFLSTSSRHGKDRGEILLDFFEEIETKSKEVKLKSEVTQLAILRDKLKLRASLLAKEINNQTEELPISLHQINLSSSIKPAKLQVNLFQKLLCLHQLTHNMTKDCSLNYEIFTVDSTLCSKCQIDSEYFCGLLRKHELYHYIWFQ